MPDWFTPAVVILGLVALALLVAYWQTRNRKYAISLFVAVDVIVLACLIAYLLPTDRKAIEATLSDIVAGIRTRDTDQVFANLATNFRYRTYDKASFRQRVDSHIRAGDAADLEMWSFEADDISRAGKTAQVHFYVRSQNVTGGRQFFLVRAEFILEADGKWRLQKFGLYNPVADTNQEFDIPGL